MIFHTGDSSPPHELQLCQRPAPRCHCAKGAGPCAEIMAQLIRLGKSTSPLCSEQVVTPCGGSEITCTCSLNQVVKGKRGGVYSTDFSTLFFIALFTQVSVEFSRFFPCTVSSAVQH